MRQVCHMFRSMCSNGAFHLSPAVTWPSRRLVISTWWLSNSLLSSPTNSRPRCDVQVTSSSTRLAESDNLPSTSELTESSALSSPQALDLGLNEEEIAADQLRAAAVARKVYRCPPSQSQELVYPP